MRRDTQTAPSSARRDPSQARVVDRHNEVIGRAEPAIRSSQRCLRIQLSPDLLSLLDVGTGAIEVPADWVAAIRRDEVRLSLGLDDPAFRAGAQPRQQRVRTRGPGPRPRRDEPTRVP